MIINLLTIEIIYKLVFVHPVERDGTKPGNIASSGRFDLLTLVLMLFKRIALILQYLHRTRFRWLLYSRGLILSSLRTERLNSFKG